VALGRSGKVEQVSKAPGTYEPVFSPSFDNVVFEFSDDRTPSDLYIQSLDDVNEVSAQRITRSALEDFDRLKWADVRYIKFRSHIDGTILFGRLYVPHNFDSEKQYPLIVGSVYSDTVRNQWGGRTAHPTWGLDQYFVSQGYLVLSVNVRGSWGQGSLFRSSRKEFGGIDVDDLESGVRYLVSQGNVDSSRVGIWGSSYGGLMTAMSLFKKPELYVAGIAGAPATNVWHAFPGEMRVMGEPKGDDYPGRYERQSALTYADDLQDPLMIIHGTKDHVVLYADSIALSEKLIAHGKSFELVTMPGVGHYWDASSIPETLFAFKKMAEFFERHLKTDKSRP
jgi:dipeptidyl-peptidase-4